MPTGPSSDSASPSPEPDPPLAGSWRHFWLARGGGWGNPVTWATVGLVLLGGSGAAVLLHEPEGRAQAQTTYCGLVTCAVLRSTAATSSVRAGAAHAAHPTPAPSSPLASAPTPTPTPTAVPTPPAPSPSQASASTSRPAPRPTPSRWPWPAWWPPSGWWGHGPGHGRGYQAAHSRGFGGWPGGGR
jgi:hypothetical protein